MSIAPCGGWQRRYAWRRIRLAQSRGTARRPRVAGQRPIGAVLRLSRLHTRAGAVSGRPGGPKDFSPRRKPWVSLPMTVSPGWGERFVLPAARHTRKPRIPAGRGARSVRFFRPTRGLVAVTAIFPTAYALGLNPYAAPRLGVTGRAPKPCFPSHRGGGPRRAFSPAVAGGGPHVLLVVGGTSAARPPVACHAPLRFGVWSKCPMG